VSAEPPARLFIPADNRPAPLAPEPVAIWADEVCQMSFGERAALEGVLSQLKPRLAIEIGTYEGGSLSFLTRHCGHVHTIDLYDLVEDRAAYDNVTFHTGDSQQLLPQLLGELEAEGRQVDLVLIDGDHSAEGVRGDLQLVLDSTATSSTLILLHDTANEETRRGIESVGLSEHPKVVYHELDFIAGYEFAGGHFDGQTWGGLAVVLTGERPLEGYREDSAQRRYREPLELRADARRTLSELQVTRERLQAALGDLEHARTEGRAAEPVREVPDTLQPVPETTSSLPMPPDELIDRVVSGFSNQDVDGHRALFLQTGRRSLEDFEAGLTAVGDTLSAHRRILEFGCGCGRIMRWMQELGESHTLVGTDIDARAVEWASGNLPFARFDVNEGLPPTRYQDGEFDLILNHSVFTHLDEHYQDQWLAELQRITAPGGVLVLSIHGEHAFQVSEQQLAPDSVQRRDWRARLERDGILFIADDSYVGSAFPDFYHTAFHAPWYVFEHWNRWFEVLAYLPRSSLDFQDQVVLRRRPEPDLDEQPLRARPGGAVAAPSPAAAVPVTPLQVPAGGSRFGRLGLAARRAIFRAARPVIHAQEGVDRGLEQAISSLEERLDETRDERMPPLVHLALRQQAERIDRLESELRELREGEAPTDGRG
jgi:SAM-dependent methyltransferase